MHYAALGRTDLRVSRLGFGCCPMGGHGWCEVSPDDVERAVRVALDGGVNFFDTADVYGLGESERRLGKALKGRRQEAIIATKGGVRFRVDPQAGTYYDNSPAWLNHALEESVRRLQVDCIDLYQVHYRDGRTPLSDVIELLEANRKAGKIRYYGLSNISWDEIASFPIPSALVTFQAQYSLASRSNEAGIAKIARNKELTLLSWGSLGQGILTGKYDVHSRFPVNDRRSRPVYVNFHGARLYKNMMLVEAMRGLPSYPARSLAQIAIRWILDYLGFGTALVGIKTPLQITENIGAFGWHLSQAEIDCLDLVSR